jgi:thioredoxin reductase (NADPH)
MKEKVKKMTKTDILIIGGGAAGLSAGQYAARAGRDVIIVESMMIGGQCSYIDQIENYPGIDKPVSGFEIGEMMQHQAEKFGSKIVYDEFVSFEKKNDTFFVKLKADTVEAKALIWATGAQHRHLNIPGETELNGRGISYCGTCDGAFFKGQTIFVIGGGDTALTDALYLNRLSDDVTIVHRRNRFRAQKNLIEQIEKSNIKTIMNKKPLEIKGTDNKVSSIVLEDVVTGEKEEHETKAVFIFAGMLPQTQLLPKELVNDHGYVDTDQRMESSMKGFFAAGDVRNTPFRQVITAASDGSVAAHCASEYIDSITGNSY